MRHFPALEIRWAREPSESDVDHLLATVDDDGPTAVEPHPLGVRVFFPDESRRDTAAARAGDRFPDATITALLVPDDGWAERSQAALRPVRIDGVIVAPPWALDDVLAQVAKGGESPVVISIQPSMGFGTGHHASTRLCLRLLQRAAPAGATVLDIGTGSGVLAIAACQLGAARALGIDVDRDALAAAAENVERNGVVDRVSLDIADITERPARLASRFSLVFANITGAMLQRHAADVTAALAPGGVLITSGFQVHERDDVSASFVALGLHQVEQLEEDTWVATSFRRRD